MPAFLTVQAKKALTTGKKRDDKISGIKYLKVRHFCGQTFSLEEIFAGIYFCEFQESCENKFMNKNENLVNKF